MRMTSMELRIRNDKLIQESEQIKQVVRQLEWDLKALIRENSDANKDEIARTRQKIKDLETERFYLHTRILMMD